MTTTRPPRGSKKHVLDLVRSDDFPASLNALLEPHRVQIDSSGIWRPDKNSEKEWSAKTFCPQFLSGKADEFASWWVGWKNPTWDLLARCTIKNQPGLLLVEAKANDKELSKGGKRLKADASQQSKDNHEYIGEALNKASAGLNAAYAPGGFNLRIDSHYQLCNRIATAWRLAQCGLPTALLYLGFTGDTGMENGSRKAIQDSDHWQRLMSGYLHGVAPQNLPGTTITSKNGAFMRFIIGTLPVVEVSPPPQNKLL
ncbi:hypothetical protein [Oceanidesulfovibrio marinus]|uniref:hypothetical protein n=1 Tax=Oceanidesulfovibrio marinus TaxID=370038 RepID=UPI0011860C1B|nr:hypothetical protein [Oceanidesulfovibrio marinus]